MMWPIVNGEMTFKKVWEKMLKLQTILQFFLQTVDIVSSY